MTLCFYLATAILGTTVYRCVICGSIKHDRLFLHSTWEMFNKLKITEHVLLFLHIGE